MNRLDLLEIARPILFNTLMVRAILDDRKKETRRPIKQPFEVHESGNEVWFTRSRNFNGEYCRFHPLEPPYKKSDILYVRETWCHEAEFNPNGHRTGEYPPYYYKADLIQQIADDKQIVKWRPSIHMPKEAARIFLRVTDVLVQRVQEITDEGALAEGIREFTLSASNGITKLYGITSSQSGFSFSAKDEFKLLWQDVYKNWTDNPWVSVIKFERIKDVTS